MQFGKRARRFVAAGAVLAGSMSAMGIAAMPASAADTLPAYTGHTYCFIQKLNLGQPAIKGETCQGYYRVTRATYKFTEDNLHICPRMGIYVHLDERWISPPTGGAPTILASYHAYL
jgi:hypothetical protein